MKNKLKVLSDNYLFISFLISTFVFIFYIFYNHLSVDTLLLFLPNKLFLGKWLRRGILPLYNPYIFLGIPFAFDVGLGNLHPFNLCFLLPYPWSFALWSALTTFLFLVGFYLLFNSIAKDKNLSWLLTLILFLSGNGVFMRNDNPTIWGVIAHFGIFAWSMKYLKNRGWKGYIPSLLWGILLTLSGHLQYVLYGYILAFVVAKIFYKVSWKKIIFYFFLLFTLTSWYFILSLPLVLESTRVTFNHNYTKFGSIFLPQLIQLILPFIFGGIRTGAKWFTVPTHTLLISYIATISFIVLLLKNKIGKCMLILLTLLFVSSLGLINFPFFRGSGQIFILIDILILLSIADNERDFKNIFYRLAKRLNLIKLMFTLIILLILFFWSPIFVKLFLNLFKILKKNPSLFYDPPTVKAIGKLFAENLVLIELFFIFLVLARKFSKQFYTLLFVFVILEGGIVNYYHTYFISQKYICSSIKDKPVIRSDKFRVQSSADVYPYFGFFSYVMGNVLFRSPFSKEPNILIQDEKSNFSYLKYIFKFNPSSWVMIKGINSVQGYSTFVPKNIAYYFNTPSSNYKDVYKKIIERNYAFGQVDKHLHINYIETSKITLNDIRWKKLGVRYVLSHTPIDGLRLIKKITYLDKPIFIYEFSKPEPIYSLRCGKKMYALKPVYRNPNKAVFKLPRGTFNKICLFKAIQNPEGFNVLINNQKVKVKRGKFSIVFNVRHEGRIEIYYSPLIHLRYSIEKYLIHFFD